MIPNELHSKPSESQNGIPLRAEFTNHVPDSTGRIMFMPAGDHTITPGAGEGSVKLTVHVDKSTVDVLNRSLDAWNERLAPQRVFIDKEHEGREATAWPDRFFWSESPAPGVYAQVQFSELGRRMVEGKTFRAFSPSFTTDAAIPKRISSGQRVTVPAGKRGSVENPARVTGLAAPDVGALTNNPAFRKILPLWARNAPAVKKELEWEMFPESFAATCQELASTQCAPPIIVAWPRGLHVGIRPAGSASSITVNIDESWALRCNRHLQIMRSRGQRPFFDFNHAAGEVGYPLEYFWAGQPGVMAVVEWTDRGNELICSGEFPSFSPTWVPIGKSDILGLMLNCGAILHRSTKPAFGIRMPPLRPCSRMRALNVLADHFSRKLDRKTKDFRDAGEAFPAVRACDELKVSDPQIFHAWDLHRRIHEELETDFAIKQA